MADSDQQASASRRAPATYKTAILMWAVLFPLTIFFRWIVSLFSLTFSPLVQTGLMMAIEVIIVSYVVMPHFATTFAFWLYPEDQTKETKS